MSFGPGLRSEVFNLPVGGMGQTGEDIAQIGVGIEAAAAATFHDGVEDGTALAGVG